MDTDEHLFTWLGYRYLIEGTNICYEMFFKLDVPIDGLGHGAKVLMSIHERMLMMQGDKDMNS